MTYRPSLSRSHWSVVRTRPEISSPVTLQTNVTWSPFGMLPTIADFVVGPLRTFIVAATVVVMVAASAVVTPIPTMINAANGTSARDIHVFVIRLRLRGGRCPAGFPRVQNGCASNRNTTAPARAKGYRRFVPGVPPAAQNLGSTVAYQEESP